MYCACSVSMNKDECFILGTVVKKYSFKGEVIIKLDTDQPEIFSGLESVLIEKYSKLIPFFIERIKIKPNGFVRVKFQGIDSEEESRHIIRSSIYLPQSFLPVLDKDKFYFHEVYGFTVIDKNKGNIGVLSSILESSVQNILKIDFNGKEILVPLHDDFIEKIDKKNKILYLKIPEGLVDLYL